MKAHLLNELKGAWAEATLLGNVFLYKNHPLRSHPLVNGLLNPRSPPVSLKGLSFSELCQLATLRAPYDGGSLLNALFPFTCFPTLWSDAKNFDLEEARLSADLLQHLLGKKEAQVDELPPYYKALLRIGKIDGDEKQSPSLASIENYGPIEAAFIHQGKRTALGALRVRNIEIPAFGPHLHPLKEPSFFGVDIDASPWGQVSADRELWFHRSGLHSGFEIQMFGLNPKRRVFFVFYVKAEKAIIEDKDFFPKTLTRFSDFAERIIFESKGTTLTVSTPKVRVELIPLAGDLSYFGSTFLLAFEVPTFDGKLGFQFT